ncbi:MAG: 2-hydroxyacyl-CoA dehydratase [Spirochaetes bacterium]|nr:2-hydroxyacyl-CoA dehydratase [Spirochaetota bacterium]
MKVSRLGHLVDPLREMLGEYRVVLGGYRQQGGLRIVGVTCDFLPQEILMAAGVMPLRLPPSYRTGCCYTAAPAPDDPYEAIVVPEGCHASVETAGVPVHRFHVPGGYGAEHVAGLRVSLNRLLDALQSPLVGEIDKARLREVMESCNILRRGVRGICSIRNQKPDLLSQEDLFAMMTAAVSLPPEVVLPLLSTLLARMNDTQADTAEGAVPLLIHGCGAENAALLDRIEDAGCVIVEDDTCGGRRQFDLSFNVDAEDPAGEMLEAASFRPLCPAVRGTEERFELFYRLLKSYGIETVLFLEEGSCAARRGETEHLRKRLMRLGVDPIVTDSGGAVEAVTGYLRRS